MVQHPLQGCVGNPPAQASIRCREQVRVREMEDPKRIGRYVVPIKAEARARAVTDYLASRGLPPDRLSRDALARHALRVERSLIRVDADEVTYNLHIMLRFELENDFAHAAISSAPASAPGPPSSRVARRSSSMIRGCLILT